jgi:hypothetical protein
MSRPTGLASAIEPPTSLRGVTSASNRSSSVRMLAKTRRAPMTTLSFVATMLILTAALGDAKDKSATSGPFNPQKNYSGIVLQQGRTTSDSDRTTSSSFSARKSNPGAMIHEDGANGGIPLQRKMRRRSN